jgi:hypothetical protein
MLPSHVKDYYPFKSFEAQEEVVQSVAGRDIKYTLYHLENRIASHVVARTQICDWTANLRISCLRLLLPRPEDYQH